MAIPLDVASVIADGRALRNSQIQAGTDLGAILASNPALNDAQLAAIKDQGTALAETEAAKQARMKSQDEQLAQINSQAGILGENGMFAQTAMQLQEMDSRLAPMRDALLAKQAVSIADSPIEWLLNQFTLPGEIDNYNAMAAGRDNLEAQLQNRMQSATQAGTMEKTLAAQTSDAEAAGKLHEISAATGVAASQATIEAAQRSITNMQVQATFAKLPFDTARDVLNVQMQAENLRLAQQRESREAKAATADEELRRLQKEKLQQEIERGNYAKLSRDEKDSKLKLASVILGKAPIDADQYELIQRSDPAQAAAYAHVLSQVDLSKGGEQPVSFGNDVAETVTFLRATGTQLKGGKAELVAQAERYISSKETTFVDSANKTFKQQTADQQKMWREKWAEEFERSFTDVNVPGSVYNTMTVDGLNKMKLGSVDLSKFSVVQNISTQFAGNNKLPVTADTVVGTALGMIAQGAKSPAEIDKISKEVAAIFVARKAEFYANYEPQRIGMKFPDKTAYVFDMGPFASPEKFDLTNETEVKNLLLRAHARNIGN